MGRLKGMCCVALLIAPLLCGCEAEEPTREDAPELITKVTVTFTPVNGGEAVVGTALDPDADGIRGIEMDGPVVLSAATSYVLKVGMYNDLADPGSDEYDISHEVEEEGDEHMIFFSWTGLLFTDPEGDGNIDHRDDPVLYDDEDDNGMPIGLSTRWVTSDKSAGKFRILLKHQPDLKSGTSSSEMGETDLDVRFEVEID